jgi:hypothetical protein
LIGEHELWLDNETLTTRSVYCESRCSWTAFEKMISTPHHIYLYNGPASAIIIPKNSVTEGDWRAAEELIKVKVNSP